MAADRPSLLVPKLRFAEFVDGPPWECPPLKKLAQRITQRNTHGADLRALTNSAEDGVVDQREYFDRDIATNTRNYFIVETGDYVYNPRISSTAPVGPVSKNQIGTGVMSPLYTVFRFRSDANDFFGHYFNSSGWHGYLRRVSNSGARHDRMAITNNDLMQMPIPTPSPREQQKVADCLGSLDNLIAAEGRKLEALRQHKQGLMQQLFPQPGETVPRLRFPEFRDAGEWEEKRLGDLGTLISGLTYSPKDVRDGGLLVLRSSNIQNGEIALDDCVYVRHDMNGADLTQPDDILICVRNGSGSLIGKNAIVPKGMPVCTHGAFMTVFRASAPHFARVLLQTTAYQKQVAADLGATINSINRSQLLKYRFTVPKPAEQQPIAACLSAVDTQVAAQARRITSLKQHKQGLLKQLFP